MIKKTLKKIVIKILSMVFKIPFANNSFKQIYSNLIHENNNKKLFSSLRLHETMMSDPERLKKYKLATEKYIKENQIVADVGTGTGFLSFLMFEKSPKKIYAIDHSNIVEIAKYLIDKNKISNVTLIKKNSKEFQPKEKVDVIFHELIGNGLINEGMINTLLDLRDRVLLPKIGKIYPSKFDLFIEPITIKSDYRRTYLWQNKIGQVDYSPLKDYLPELTKNNLSFISRYQIARILSSPKSILSFDLMKINENEFPKNISFNKKINYESSFDGFCLFFKVIFDDEIFFDTFPDSPKTHWENVIPYFRFSTRKLSKNQEMNCSLKMKDHNFLNSWEIETQIV